MRSEPEKEGYKFGYSCFKEQPPAETIAKDVKLQPDEEITIPETECTLPVPTTKLCNLQLQDGLCQKKAKQVKTNTDTSNSYYIDTDGILRKLWQDNKEVSNTIVLPKILMDPVLQLAHDSAGHNGFQQVYLSIRRLYSWNNMKKDILHHCKHCAICEKFKMERIKFEKLHFNTPLPTNGIHQHGSYWRVLPTNE